MVIMVMIIDKRIFRFEVEILALGQNHLILFVRAHLREQPSLTLYVQGVDKQVHHDVDHQVHHDHDVLETSRPNLETAPPSESDIRSLSSELEALLLSELEALLLETCPPSPSELELSLTLFLERWLQLSILILFIS